MDLLEVVTEGAMRALALHANDQGVDGVACLPRLRTIIRDEWPELLDSLKDETEAGMNDQMAQHAINVYCNAWAVKAIKEARRR